ncbi:MAG TPA: hypothetical protein PK819_09005 [Thermomicrobiales bacterium]|nr:hypothetical protein [Thermomicrobiales bacterium]
MIKQRILGLALALALVGSAGIGLSNSASADSSGNVLVTGSVNSVLSLTLNTNSISFGTGLNFLGAPGTGSNTGRGACSLPDGARYISQDVVSTVVSSTSYDLSLRSNPDPNTLATFSTYQTLARIGAGGYTDCPSTDSAPTLQYIANSLIPPIGVDPLQHYVFAPNQAGTLGRQHVQYYTLDAVINGPTGSFSAMIIYEVQAL